MCMLFVKIYLPQISILLNLEKNRVELCENGKPSLLYFCKLQKHTPAPFIKDMFEASMFFVNRVLKERKDDKVCL